VYCSCYYSRLYFFFINDVFLPLCMFSFSFAVLRQLARFCFSPSLYSIKPVLALLYFYYTKKKQTKPMKKQKILRSEASESNESTTNTKQTPSTSSTSQEKSTEITPTKTISSYTLSADSNAIYQQLWFEMRRTVLKRHINPSFTLTTPASLSVSLIKVVDNFVIETRSTAWAHSDQTDKRKRKRKVSESV